MFVKTNIETIFATKKTMCKVQWDVVKKGIPGGMQIFQVAKAGWPRAQEDGRVRGRKNVMKYQK